MSTTHLVQTPSPTLGGRIAVVTGFVLHAVACVFVISSGLMMPMWAIILLAGFWTAALGFAIRQRHRPPAVLLTPVVTFAVWFLTGWAGETFLGWTA